MSAARRPYDSNAYEFVVIASRRAHQLMAGCIPLMTGVHKATTMAQMEVAAGKIVRIPATSTVDGGTLLVEV
jgi:DNA-directed RNA polymerase subunit K/omega